MENHLRIKQSCPNCARTNCITDLNKEGTFLFTRKNWRCSECKTFYDTKVWLDNGYVYQMAMGSARVEDYQKYNNYKIRANK